MKCLVCGQEYELAQCPRCGCPDIQILGSDREQAMAILKPTIDAYRLSYLKSVQVQVVTYHWKDREGTVVLDREEAVSFGTGDSLMEQECYLPGKFARIADEQQIPVTVRVTVKDKSHTLTVNVPNLHKPELQQLGAKVDGQANLILMLRNETEAPTASVPVSLFI